VSYNLVYTQRALRDIDKLESSIRRRIGRVLLRYQGNPMKHAERIKDPRLGS